ncbi:hypothetical protein ACFE04_006385 [Oxalis oulophora]
MATLTQSLVMTRPLAGVSNGTRLSQFVVLSTTRQLPSLRRNSCLLIRATSEEKESVESGTVTPQSSPSTPPASAAPRVEPSPTITPKAKTGFGDLFAFSGPAPERINGRLAMVGFVSAIAVELLKGQDVFSQINNGGVEWFLGASVLLTVASLVPLFKGENVETKTKGLMNSNAELWNGRFAMLGLVALVFTEYVKGGALV